MHWSTSFSKEKWFILAIFLNMQDCRWSGVEEGGHVLFAYPLLVAKFPDIPLLAIIYKYGFRGPFLSSPKYVNNTSLYDS